MTINADNWFVKKNEITMGPFTFKRMVQLKSDGKINEATLIKSDSMSDWAQLATFDDFSGAFDVPEQREPITKPDQLTPPKKKKKKKPIAHSGSPSAGFDAGGIVIFVAFGLMNLSLILPWVDLILIRISGFQTFGVLLLFLFVHPLLTVLCKLKIPLIFGVLQWVTFLIGLFGCIPFAKEGASLQYTGVGIYVAFFAGFGLILGSCLHFNSPSPKPIIETGES